LSYHSALYTDSVATNKRTGKNEGDDIAVFLFTTPLHGLADRRQHLGGTYSLLLQKTANSSETLALAYK
jgi:hypothetical protein